MGHEDRSGQHANSFHNLCDLNNLDLLHVAFEASLPRVQPFPLSGIASQDSKSSSEAAGEGTRCQIYVLFIMGEPCTRISESDQCG
ncbi:hypothetical protein HO173_005041 [Letharia columbiana]|uniref:Uncharacterized protein n=1 Tax=Letharia columbiana TaxID=112416 RepID=A0A8H6FXN2_9LECA|nr:uncharacterized protein HO173_005041 [Letharia columbiana]KAF6236750.1 hypothetical protein HO173_005041 [Letharia columbiana]